MANFLSGLLGSNTGPQRTAAAGLLGKYYDPAEKRRMMLSQGLMGAGIGMLQNGRGSTGEVIGNSLAAGLMGANNAGLNYKADALGYHQLEQQMNEQKEKQKQKEAIMSFVSKLSPEDQKMAEAYPEIYAQQYLQSKFSTTAPKGPDMDTLYDENTGQPYKAQWDPVKKEWFKVGGTKADENGVTITSPDGTTTQIGGSGTKSTEADRRAKLLIDQIIQQEAPLMQAFDSLASGQNTVGSAAGAAGRAFMTADGQNADDALTNVVANWLYLTSGATATDAEVARQVAMIKPTALDKPENIATKKARLGYIFETMKMRSGIAVNPVAPVTPTAPKPPVTINGYTIQEIP